MLNVSHALAAFIILAPVCALAQSAPPTADRPAGVFAMHVAVGPGKVATPSFGTVRDVDGRTVMTQRRALRGRCQWVATADLPLESGDFLPLRSPASFASAEQFGVFHATMFSAMAAQKDAEPRPEQHGCVREITTRLAQRMAGAK